MKSKVIFIFVLVLCLIFCFVGSASAFTVFSTYSDVYPTSTQAINLLNCAMNYSDFEKSDWVIFRDSSYSYYIVWSDELNVTGDTVKSSSCDFIHYHRTGSSGDYSYIYEHGTDTSFQMTSVNLNVSNIEGYGFMSSTYDDWVSHRDNIRFFIIVVSVLLALLFFSMVVKK